MRTRVLFSALLLIPVLVSAQTYYYVNTISVDPPAPTDQDLITITVNGDLSSTASSILSVDHSVVGNTVNITINATNSGIGLDVLVPHEEQFELGMLPEGEYTIALTGSFIWDMAPEPQHHFTVTRTDLPACDSVDVLSIEWAPFTDTALVVHVINSSSEIFGYPGFLLYNQMGDTLAMESVYYFGIATESWHLLTVHPGADLSSPSFIGGLELWTGFYTDQVCAWNIPVELCPQTPCSPLYPTMTNTGGGLTEGIIPWSILDDQNIEVANGYFELTSLDQIDQDTLCLPPGNYTLVASYQDPLLGQPQIYVGSPNPQASTTSQPFITGGQPNNHPFAFYAPCAGESGVSDRPTTAQPLVTIMNGELMITSADQGPIGSINVTDATGRSIASTRSTDATWRMSVNGLSNGVYLATITTPSGVTSTARVVIGQ